MHPFIWVTIDGIPLSAASFSRLISATVNDRMGTRSDTIDLEFDAQGLAIPREKAIITAQYGIAGSYGGPWIGEYADFGSFTADDIELSTFPHKIKVQGKSASIHQGVNDQRERNWDSKTAADVLGDLAQEMGLKLQIDPAIASVARDWWGQEGVSNGHFIRQLAGELNADATFKNGQLLITQKGQGLSAAGVAVAGLTIRPDMHIAGSMSVKFKAREKHATVEAEVYDRDTAKREKVFVAAHKDGSGTHRMRHPFKNKDEAKKAAESRARQLQTRAQTTSVTLVSGNARARGGGNFTYAGFHPEIDGVPFTIESASHAFSKGGSWQVSVQGKSK